MLDMEKVREVEMTEKLEWLDSVDEIVVGGQTEISDEVVSQVIGLAAQEVEGVSGMGKASITRSIAKAFKRSESKSTGVASAHGHKEAAVDLTIGVIYDFNIPQIIIDVRKNVAARLFDVCGFVTKEVNVQIISIDFPEKKLSKLD